MIKKINDLYNYIVDATEEWTLDEFERLLDELDSHKGVIEEETCDHCDHRPSTGACFYCKQD